MGKGLPIIEDSQSHSDTPHLVALLWTSDQPGAKTSSDNTHITHKRQTSTSPAGFEPTIPVRERPQAHALDLASTAIGEINN